MAHDPRDGPPPKPPRRQPPAPRDPLAFVTARERVSAEPPEARLCRLCEARPPDGDVLRHVIERHPEVSPRAYAAKFPAVTRPAPDTTAAEGQPSDTRPDVDPAQVATHPGGREAGLLEAELDPAEQRAYRADVESLLAQGYRPGWTLASCAYYMLLTRRLRFEHEATRRAGAGPGLDDPALKDLVKLEDRLRQLTADLERVRLDALDRAGARAPLAVVEEELQAAEAWVRATQGEHALRCPGCGQPLTAPALPHWAFAPIATARGTEWAVWSPELWTLVETQVIPPWAMAYALRTSLEALKRTHERRGGGSRWPPTIALATEEARLRQALDARERPPAAPARRR